MLLPGLCHEDGGPRTGGAGVPKPLMAEIVSESGEAYENKSYAMEAARRFGPADAEIEVEE
jgi:hypothetical protein